MSSSAPLQFLFIFCALSVISLHFDIFKPLYSSSVYLDQAVEINYFLLLFFIGTCVYRIIDSWRLYVTRKITHFDVSFLIVHNSFALIQLCSSYVLYTYFGKQDKYKALIQPAMLLADWSLLPFFSWIALWSRHVRRGWNSRHNFVAFMISIFGFFLCLLHQSMFFFLIGIAVTMSAIALYETYKVHFYRMQITPLFFALSLLHAVLLVTCNVKPLLTELTQVWAYVYVTSFTLITSLTNRMNLRILIETNQHKA